MLIQTCERTGSEAGSLTLCKMETLELSMVPTRWDFARRTKPEAIAEIDRCAGILADGAERLCGLYLKICDMIRWQGLTPDEIREVLSKHFPSPRVSEFIRVSNAEPEVYRRYRCGIIGFRAVLDECRGYRIHDNKWRLHRKIRRAAERLIALLGSGELTVCGHRVIVI